MRLFNQNFFCSFSNLKEWRNVFVDLREDCFNNQPKGQTECNLEKAAL